MQGLDHPWIVAHGPCLLQAVLQTVGDLHLHALALRVFAAPTVARWALAVQLSSCFTFYCGVRTFSSSTEAVLVAVGLARWPPLPWDAPGRAEGAPPAASAALPSLCVAALATLIRPTSALIWASLCLWHAVAAAARAPSPQRAAAYVAKLGCLGALVLCSAAACGVLVDRWVYGSWLLTPWSFVRFNVIANGASLYGTHPWHWYATAGWPAVLGPWLPLAAVGGWAALSGRLPVLVGQRTSALLPSLPAIVLLASTVALSAVGHKEDRFLLPLLPLALLYAAAGAAWVLSGKIGTHSTAAPTPVPSPAPLTAPTNGATLRHRTPQRPGAPAPPRPPRVGRTRALAAWTLVVLSLALNALAALYLSLVHQVCARRRRTLRPCLTLPAQAGPISVMRTLRGDMHGGGALGRECSTKARVREGVLFLTPCHATPLYSHLHKGVPLRFLDCSPE